MDLSVITFDCKTSLDSLLDFLQNYRKETRDCEKLQPLKAAIHTKITGSTGSVLTRNLIELIAAESWIAVKELIDHSVTLDDELSREMLEKIVLNKQPGEDELMWLLYLFPNKKWDWNKVHRNPNFYPDRLTEFGIEHKLNYFELGLNPNLTIEFLKARSLENWNWEDVSANSVFTADDILDNKQLKWDRMGLSRNTNFNMKILEWLEKKKSLKSDIDAAQPDYYNENDHSIRALEWCNNKEQTEDFLKNIIGSKGLSPKDLINRMEGKLTEKGFNIFLKMLSRNPGLTLDEVLKYPEGDWDWVELSSRLKLTPKDLEKFPKIEFWGLSGNEKFPLSYIIEHPSERWYWDMVCGRRDLAPYIIRGFHDHRRPPDPVREYLISGSWWALSANLTIPWWLIRETIQTNGWKWDIYALFMRPDADHEFLYNLAKDRGEFNWENSFLNPVMPLNFFIKHKHRTVLLSSDVYKNPNITIGYVLLTLHKTFEGYNDQIFQKLSSNLFTKNEYYQRTLKRKKALPIVKEHIQPPGLGEIMMDYI